MSHEHDTPDTGSMLADDAAPQTEPDFLTRARRILGGDIRPEDYLPITPEVRAAADFEMTHMRALTKIEPLPEVVEEQLRGWLLSFHHGGQNILFIEDATGVIVLAAGLDQVGEFFRGIPTALQRDREITSDVPEPF